MMKKLEKTEERNPFKVPEGYFEEVNRKIISATSGRIEAGRRGYLFSGFRSYIMAAASVAGFIILSYTAIRIFSSQSIHQAQPAVFSTDNESLYINDLDTYSLEERAASLAIPEQGPDASNTEIIEYLVFENIEISDIYEQF
jgi:hypothetical protein